jgi:drug/metabolite transporter (DMT)-like permease
MTLFVFSIALISVTLNALAQIALRKTMVTTSSLVEGSQGLVDHVGLILLSPWFIGGMMCFVVSLGLWMFVLGKVEVSQAYPLVSIGYILAAIIGHFYLGESVGMVRIAGIGVICVGIVIMAQG